MLIRDIMHAPVITLPKTATIRDGMALLLKHRIRHLPVVDALGRLYGIVTDRDVREAGPSRLHYDEDDFRVFDEPITRIAKTDVVTTHPDEFVEEAAFIMKQYRIGCLPVVSRGEVVGIVTHSDLLNAVITLMGVDQPSSRLEIEVPDRTGMIADLTAIFKAQEVNIVSLFVYRGTTPGYRRVAVRARTMDPRRLIASIREAGFIIRWPTHPDHETLS
ncbi:MAG: CBS domain-containing protein [Hydrogenibacillus sp.]|nr:CBS domain-containing protein [Hydrogenibacillus sp.]